ncbi:hypothetical protein AMET1_1340 [Methanonatronarchaeum thermophilum]|uniref:Uncharacterized protein n=1 Tax=Methanonatronarchaeum thermophilum TaxID=1927129 RepID=A0A1Y3GE01_9EURY|nr:hypothetical protein [Methanonatronarchaeum thermophilum]OUJ18424.1 hypothetical protein AMET1_1340 [Methanonatronarchaeum thermophilum]
MHHLIVNCVGNKTQKGPQIKNYSENILQKPKKWIEDLQNQKYKKRAINLYQGSMWSTYIQAYKKLPEPKQLWIASAGLGLINAEDKVPGYNATFKPNQPNSVAKTQEEKTLWWSQITKNNNTDRANTIAKLTNRLNKNDLLITTMGKHYYQAIYNDLKNIKNTKPKIGLIGIKKQNGYIPKIPKHLEKNAIPYTDYRKLRKKLDCSMIQVHPKTTIKTIEYYKKTGKLPKTPEQTLDIE